MVSKEESGNGGGTSFYEDEANLKKLCNFLRSNEGPPVREAVQMDQRVYYLKGALLYFRDCTNVTSFDSLFLTISHVYSALSHRRRKIGELLGGTKEGHQMAIESSKIRVTTGSD